MTFLNLHDTIFKYKMINKNKLSEINKTMQNYLHDITQFTMLIFSKLFLTVYFNFHLHCISKPLLIRFLKQIIKICKSNYFILKRHIGQVSIGNIMTLRDAVKIQKFYPWQGPHTSVSESCRDNFSTKPYDSQGGQVTSKITVFTGQKCLYRIES